mgnify:CR=1 FL=1
MTSASVTAKFSRMTMAVAPEFQLTNESTVVGYINFMQGVISAGVGDKAPFWITRKIGRAHV